MQANGGGNYRQHLNNLATQHWQNYGKNEGRSWGNNNNTSNDNDKIEVGADTDKNFNFFFTPTNPDENYAGSKMPVNYSTADNLNALMSRSNPLVQMAKTRAAQLANSRGLLNSSLALQAGEQAAMEMMLPVAQADAELYNRRWLEQERIGADAELAAEERDMRYNMFQGEQNRHTYSGINNADSIYSQMFSNIVNNPNYSAADREKLFRHISLIRDSSYEQLNAIYGTNLTWQTAVNQ